MFWKKREYTDKELIAGCAHNSRKHQELLYRRYFPKMMGLLMRQVKDRDRALDILNQGFLKIFKSIGELRDEQALEGWIRVIIMRAKADEFRKDKRYLQTIVLEEPSREIGEDTGLNHLYFKDVIKMLDHLPPATAEVFRLFAVEGYKHTEIAEQLGISAGTSKWHLATARQKLRELIQQQGIRKDAG